MAHFKELAVLRKALQETDERREGVIRQSREILRVSKQMIYSLHRGEKDSALMAELQEKVRQLPSEFHDANIQHEALQEYAEAMCFFELLATGNLPTTKDLEVDADAYLLGLCDLTGELLRYGINGVAHGDAERLFWAKGIVEEIYGEFLKFDLRNGDLRRKVDSVKYNLKKLEEVAADIQLRKK